MTRASGLVGDIGGTHARFALTRTAGSDAAITEPRSFDNRDYPSVYAAVEAYLTAVGADPRPERAVLAVAGPVTDGAIHFTNGDWSVSEAALRRDSGFKVATLVNDFAAQAYGAPEIAPDQLRRIGAHTEGLAGAAIAVLGPGTGFGVSALVRDGDHSVALATEGGHVSFAPTDDLDLEVCRRMMARRGHVSIERILSGPGLFELYLILAEIEGASPTLSDEAEVQRAAAADTLAANTVDRFCRILGSTAGDIALGLGARGGVYVTGGVAQRMVDQIASSAFRERFEAKGRFQDYMKAIPTFVILDPFAALLGAASLLKTLETA